MFRYYKKMFVITLKTEQFFSVSRHHTLITDKFLILIFLQCVFDTENPNKTASSRFYCIPITLFNWYARTLMVL